MAQLNGRCRTLAGGAAAAATVAYWLPSSSLVSASARHAFGVRATIDSPTGVALTFDDGPHPLGTPAILKLLADTNTPAAFFLAAEQVERHPQLAAEIGAAGHQVGVHCYRHRNLMRLTPHAVRDDLNRAYDIIASATGLEPSLYRPPYGILTTAALGHADRYGWDTVLWRKHGADWSGRATPASIADRITQNLATGDVLLLHDSDRYAAHESWRHTASALPLILEQLAVRGLAPERL